MIHLPEIFHRQGLNWALPHWLRLGNWPLGTKYWPLVIFMTMNSIVLFNALVHPAAAAYDGGSHLAYIQVLAHGRLPTPWDTNEFFSPPLPYILPALAYAAGLAWSFTEKLAQIQNVFVSMGTIFIFMQIAQKFHPGNNRFKVASLALLALMPVYYKSFAFVRGEPWVTLFCVLITYEIISINWQEDSLKKLLRRAGRLGLWLGLAALARQWGFLLWISVALFLLGQWWHLRTGTINPLVQRKETGLAPIRNLRGRMPVIVLCTFIIALAVSGWFYLHLQLRYESIAAFNRPLQPLFSQTNSSYTFYTGLGNGKLFSEPIRPSFPNQFWPQFYAEFWGDYEAYFLVYGRDLRTNHWLTGLVLEEALQAQSPWLDTNRNEIAAYLGRVNLAALGISALFIAGIMNGFRFFWLWLKGKNLDKFSTARAFIWLVIAVSAFGYFVFLILVPNPGNGDTIKATYLLHTYPLIALLTADLLETIRSRSRLVYRLLWLIIGLTSLLLIPTFYTHYT